MYMFTLFILGMWVRALKKCCTDGMFQGKFHFAGQKKHYLILFYFIPTSVHQYIHTPPPPHPPAT